MLLSETSFRFSSHHFKSLKPSRTSSRFFIIRSILPFSPKKAKYYKEAEAAVLAVEKACRLCVDVKRSLFSGDGRILEKNDQTPVTIADFGVQALVSLELNKSFPSIPLVAEEDSEFLRSTSIISEQDTGHSCNSMVDSVLSAVNDKVSVGDEPLTCDDVLEAIDRGGKDAFAFGVNPATYWVLDPIDGTRGFLKGSEALYVVGLALVVEGEIALGVMGCPNWQEDKTGASEPGVIMVAHVGCGTWTKRLSKISGSIGSIHDGWIRCFVDKFCLMHEARYCISDSQTWESLPLSISFTSTTEADGIGDTRKVVLLPICCGSLCKYLMVASGRASVFILRARVQTVIKAWDHAVGLICVLEAGGQVTDWTGSGLDFEADQVGRRVIFPSGGVLATNGFLHNKVLEFVSSKSPVV